MLFEFWKFTSNDISGSKRIQTAHAIGLSLRLSVFNPSQAWYLHNKYGLSLRFSDSIFSTKRNSDFWENSQKWDSDQEQEVMHHVDHVALMSLVTFQCDVTILRLCLSEKMLPSDYDQNHFFKLKIDLMIFWINFVTLTGIVQKKLPSNVDSNVSVDIQLLTNSWHPMAWTGE